MTFRSSRTVRTAQNEVGKVYEIRDSASLGGVERLCGGDSVSWLRCNASFSREEHDTICALINLAVPYCGSYLEGRAWDEEDEEAYARFQRKRIVYAEQELADLRKKIKQPLSVRK